MASYRLSDRALKDLDRLYEHGILSFGLSLADEFYDGLIARFQAIADQPSLYPAIDDIREGYRRSVCGAHSIYFRIDSEGVEILRILGREDPTKSF